MGHGCKMAEVAKFLDVHTPPHPTQGMTLCISSPESFFNKVQCRGGKMTMGANYLDVQRTHLLYY